MCSGGVSALGDYSKVLEFTADLPELTQCYTEIPPWNSQPPKYIPVKMSRHPARRQFPGKTSLIQSRDSVWPNQSGNSRRKKFGEKLFFIFFSDQIIVFT